MGYIIGANDRKEIGGVELRTASANGTLRRQRCMSCHFSFSDERRDVTAWEGTPQRPQMAAECEASQLQLERLLREISDDLYC